MCLRFFFFFLFIRRPPTSTLFPTRRSSDLCRANADISSGLSDDKVEALLLDTPSEGEENGGTGRTFDWARDRKSTRLNSSHVSNSYAVFCLKKKNHDVKHDYSQPPIRQYRH